MSQFTAREKAKCAEREADMRRRVYPRRNGGAPLSASQVREIEMMDEIAADYRAMEKAAGEDLFGADVD
jgi:hypothetical protein